MATQDFFMAAGLLAAAAGCTPASQGTEPPQELPATLGAPVLALDLPPSLGVAPGTARVSFASAIDGSSKVWISPELVLGPAGVKHLPDGRIRHVFTAPPESLAELTNSPALRAHPGAALGYAFKLCTTGPLPAAGELSATVRLVIPPTVLVGPDVYDPREDPIRKSLAPCGAG